MKKNRIIAIGVAVAMTLIVCGCQSSNNKDKDGLPKQTGVASTNSPKDTTTNNKEDSTITEDPQNTTLSQNTTEPNNTNAPDNTSKADSGDKVDNNGKTGPQKGDDKVKAGKIYMELDKNRAAPGSIIKATVKIENIKNFAGYQINIKYDQNVLKPVNHKTGEPFNNNSMLSDGTVLLNSEYGMFPKRDHKIEEGILNFSKMYMDISAYKSGGVAEESGQLGIIGFKVLSQKSTTIKFQEAAFMPNSRHGVTLFDWDGNKVTDYSVIESVKVN